MGLFRVTGKVFFVLRVLVPCLSIGPLVGTASAQLPYELPNDDAACPAGCRQIPWRAGSDQWNNGRLPSYASTACSGLVPGNDRVDNAPVIQACIDRAIAGTAVTLPAGTFFVEGSIDLKSQVILRGAGAPSPWLPAQSPDGTTLKFGSDAIIRMGIVESVHRGAERRITSGYAKGSTQLTMAPGHGLVAGAWISVFADGDDAIPVSKVGIYGGDGCTWCGENNGDNLIQQFVQVLSVNGNTITINRPLYYTYTSAQNPGAKKMTWGVDRAGLESLKIWGFQDVGYKALVDIADCLYCWVRGIETYNAGSGGKGNHINIAFSHGVEVRDSYLHHGRDSGSDRNYGLAFFFWNSDHKIENNILRKHRHSVVFEGGGAGCAILYNYIDDNHDNVTSYITVGSPRVNHGAHPMFNLYEGNHISHIVADNYFGTSSHMVFFRNWLRGDQTGTEVPGRDSPSFGHAAVDIWPQNHYYSFVGNVLGEPDWSEGVVRTLKQSDCDSIGYGDAAYVYGCSGEGRPFSSIPGDTAINHGNHDYLTNSVAYWEGGSNHTLKASLYYSTRPWFLRGCVWPIFGPDASPVTGALPARERYLGVHSCGQGSPGSPRVVPEE